MKNNNLLIDVILENMEYFNFSNNDLSKITGISENTINNILSNKTAPDLETLSKMETAFELEKGDLITFSQNIIKNGRNN